ncbi:glutamate-cysteine ligase catalytic subunit [Rhodotorula toruloides]|uniref:Glutamate--cysteine ligase n=1 Tax=Rhodotorula toruloides TaxID=5286 RepID=A0A511KCF9_RHOTO|nr:glutamate-cysteine ligase catalytic subunit [Rhodotorula toruloides]
MGLLALGTPLVWSEAKKHAEYVREHGIEQFLNIWERLKDRTGDRLLWGDEIEYLVISYDDANRNACLSLRQTEILQDLQADAEARRERGKDEVNGNGVPAPRASKEACIPVFHPEYGRYMLESTPGAPYGATLEDLLLVEGNMRFRRKLAKSRMKPHEVPLTLTSFPRLGAPGQFTDPYYPPGGGVARSLFLPDEVINQHVRFPTLTANIRRRRGSKVAINMPVFFDEKTPRPFVDPTVPRDRNEWPEDKNAREGAALDDHIYMDAMGFGMGCCCLQITFQACSVGEARRMYDAFVPVGPIMLALSAAAPIFRGLLADVDCRWDVIAGSVDDRTEEERGLKPLQHDRFLIPKSRYDSVDCYIADTPFNRPEYNDNNMPIDPKIRDHLIDRGVDPLLATHFAHLFIRDPIVIFEETMCQDDAKSSDHFENIQSTNWQTVRFKPPPPGSPIGWRVEFRSMEVQLTDYENAAFSVFVVLLTRAIMTLGLNFYLPISKVDENMHRAHRRDAINTQKFYFRKNVFDPKPGHPCDPSLDAANPQPAPASDEATLPSASAFSRGRTNGFAPHVRDASVASTEYPASPTVCSSHAPSRSASPAPEVAFGPVEDEYDEFSINEIINGSTEKGFPGLIGVVEQYLDGLEKEGKVSEEVRKGIDRSVELIRRRADGSLITLATYIRRFVRSHPSYAHDSVVSQEINYDLIRALDEVEQGKRPAPELLPEGWRTGYEEDKKGRSAFGRCCGDVVGDVAADDAQSEGSEGSEGFSAGAAVIEDKGLCCGPMEPAPAAKEA